MEIEQYTIEQWVIEEIGGELKKNPESQMKMETACQNVGYNKSVIRGKFVTMNTYVKKNNNREVSNK